MTVKEYSTILRPIVAGLVVTGLKSAVDVSLDTSGLVLDKFKDNILADVW